MVDGVIVKILLLFKFLFLISWLFLVWFYEYIVVGYFIVIYFSFVGFFFYDNIVWVFDGKIIVGVFILINKVLSLMNNKEEKVSVKMFY